MKRFALFALSVLLVPVALAQMPTPVALSIMSDTNGAVLSPTNFWEANADHVAAPQQAGTVILDGTNGNDSTAVRGTTKPYATLSAALGALRSGDLLQIRPGTYTVAAQYYVNDSDALTLTHALDGLSDVTIQGHGAVIYATNFGNILTVQNCTNIVFEGIEFRSATITTNEIGTNYIAAAVNFRGTNNGRATWRGCRFVNLPDQAISHCWPTYARPSYDWEITDSYFSNVGCTNHPRIGAPDGAMVSGRPRRLIFSNNRSDGLCVYGVELDGGGTGSPPDSFGELVMVGNILRGIYRHGVVASGTSNCPIENLTITKNYIEFHASGGGSGILLGAARHAQIEGNEVVGGVTADAPSATKRWGVLLSTTYNEEHTWSNIVVRGNLFRGGTYGVGTAFNATAVAAKIFGVTVEGNTFIDQGEGHVLVSGSGWTISNNGFLGCGRTASPTYPWAIWAYDFTEAPLSNCTVSGNILNDLAATPRTTRFMRISYTTSTPSQSVRLMDNTVLRMSGTNAYESPSAVVGSPTTSLAAGHAICPMTPTMRVAGSGGAVTLTSTPSIINAIDGVELRLIGTSDSNTLTLQDDGTLSGSRLQLGSTNRVLGLGDILSLRFDGSRTNWFETGFNNN